MALSTYTELQAAVASWLHREDLGSVIPDLIALAEARHARDLRLLPMLTSASLATVAGVSTVALPDGWLEGQSLTLTAQALPLDPLPAGRFAAAYASDAPAMPRHYRVQGLNLVLGPTPDAVYSLAATYFARPASLSGATSSNWLLTTHPGLYLWGALAEAAPFIGSDSRARLWEDKYASELAAARLADGRATGGSLRMRTR